MDPLPGQGLCCCLGCQRHQPPRVADSCLHPRARRSFDLEVTPWAPTRLTSCIFHPGLEEAFGYRLWSLAPRSYFQPHLLGACGRSTSAQAGLRRAAQDAARPPQGTTRPRGCLQGAGENSRPARPSHPPRGCMLDMPRPQQYPQNGQERAAPNAFSSSVPAPAFCPAQRLVSSVTLVAGGRPSSICALEHIC